MVRFAETVESVCRSPTSDVIMVINTGKKTEWSPIRSVIIRVITKSDLLITSMITDRHRTTGSPVTQEIKILLMK